MTLQQSKTTFDAIARRWQVPDVTTFCVLVEHAGTLFGNDGHGWMYWSKATSGWRWDIVESPAACENDAHLAIVSRLCGLVRP